LAGFVDDYRKKRGLNRSQVFEEASGCSEAANWRPLTAKPMQTADKELDNTIGDGLADEAW
jgi:hypothetical protein